MKLKQIPKSWYFLIFVLFAYILLFFIKQEVFLSSMNFFYNTILKIIPIFLLIFILMAVSNYFITPKFIIKHLKKKGIRKWLFVIIGGILSSGPIYMWYPLLADLKKRGLEYGLISCFLYNRAIKIPLIPIVIFYFGLKYVLVLLFVMILISIVQGILLNKLMEVKNEDSSSI